MDTSHTEQDDLLLPQEAAEALRVKRATLAYWRHRKQGPVFVRVGGRVRYPRASIRSYLEAHTVALAAA